MIRDAARISLSKPFATLTMAVVVSLLPWLPGCGGNDAEFSKETQYTPETLAQEFVFRYKSLPERRSNREKSKADALEKFKASVPDADEARKSAKAEASKKGSAPTLEGLVAEFSTKLGSIPSLPRPEASKQFLSALSKDSTVKPDDLKAITEQLGN
ncbi:hypothetical protein [Singulisphaera sp. PoT]|uniref:hypothetical protein n=1 Tax=Singulisphaera sp. PoT TaxID=3411797 RepID=UPI003BF50D63